jgi:hypothetical protein
MCSLWKHNRKKIYVFQRIWLAVLWSSQYLLIIHIHMCSHFFPFPHHLIGLMRKCFWWWCGTPHVTGYMTVRVGCSHLYRVGPQSLLNHVFPILESKYVATCKKVSVTLRLKLNVHFEMTAIQTVLTQSDETKKLIHCKFLLKQFDHFFVYCIRT